MRIIICFFAILIMMVTQASAQWMSQAGFVPGGQKRLFLDGTYEKAPFKILDGSGKEVFSGVTTAKKYWPHSGTQVCVADFSALNQEQSYTMVVEGVGGNFAFAIQGELYREVGSSLMKSFYMARASEKILPAYAGEYARAAGHPDDHVLIHASAASPARPEGTVISSPGGWYDAGDYNKYIVNSSITTYSLLHLYELFSSHLGAINLNIPESDNQVADLLDETLYNLRWMLTMQDPNDGGVYHKLTSKTFCGMVMPHQDQLPRYVVMKTTSATLGFAATMAKASRVLKPLGGSYATLSETCLKAAQAAWKWAQSHPDTFYQQPSDIKTGPYPDQHLKDEFEWAGMELLLSTGNKQYKNNGWSKTKLLLPSWGSVNTLGVYSLVADKSQTVSQSEKDLLYKKLLKMADRYCTIYEESAFHIPAEDFPWGSNSELCNQAILLMHAYLITKEDKYLAAADACTSYLLGANPTGYCFITGFGTKQPMFVHDRRCSADQIEAPIPGLMVGGPSTKARKDCGEENYSSKFPALSYVDMACSYSTNEVAINWNSAAVFLFLGLDAINSSK